MTPKIELKNLVKKFGTKHVLDGLDLSVYPQESLVVLGGSGTGKSVMLKCILGLLEPDEGSILVDGKDTTHLHGRDLRNQQQRFGMLFQGGALFDSLPVWRNVIFALTKGHTPPKSLRAQAVDLLKRVGLGESTADLMPAELSGGMQKRVALARAIAAKPEIVFFDEPTTGLDPIRADVIDDLILEQVKDLGITAITITHDIASALKIADRVAVLHQGKLVWDGPRDKLMCSGNPYVDQFVHGRAKDPPTATGRNQT